MSKEIPFQKVGIWGKLVSFSNIALLVILPLTWFLPLLRSNAFIFVNSEISIWSGAMDLLDSDLFLFILLVLFAMIMPLVKTIIYVVVWFSPTAHLKRLLTLGSIAAKLSMTDVFLIALTIVGLKGISVGRIYLMYGFYFFSGVIIFSIFISLYTDITLKRTYRE